MDKRTEHNKTKQNSPFQIICNSTKAQYEAFGLKQNHTSNLQKNQKRANIRWWSLNPRQWAQKNRAHKSIEVYEEALKIGSMQGNCIQKQHKNNNYREREKRAERKIIIEHVLWRVCDRCSGNSSQKQKTVEDFGQKGKTKKPKTKSKPKSA